MNYRAQMMGANAGDVVAETVDSLSEIGVAFINKSSLESQNKTALEIAKLQNQGSYSGDSGFAGLGMSGTTIGLVAGGAVLLVLGAVLLSRK